MDFKSRYKYNSKTDLLGRGGFATVYKAQDTLLGRTVALKFFKNANDDKHTLIKEISRAIALEHPNLCRYYDATLLQSENMHGETEKIEVGVMEYLDGGHLKTYLFAHPEHIDKLLIDVLRGLEFLHESGIIHRDLKPQNILIKLTPKGPVAKITDFGISKDIGSDSNNSSKLMGTVEYMAPEQFNPGKYGINGKITTNLDLWSFGLMVYELRTGSKMFGNRGGGQDSVEQIMRNILNDEQASEKIQVVPEPYRTLLKMTLVKDANKRVQNAGHLIAVLQGKGPINPPPADSFTKPISNMDEGPGPTQPIRPPKPGPPKPPFPPKPPVPPKPTPNTPVSPASYVVIAIVAIIIVVFLVFEAKENKVNEISPSYLDSTAADSTAKVDTTVKIDSTSKDTTAAAQDFSGNPYQLVDGFDDNSNNWVEYNDKEKTMSIKNGEFLIKGLSPKYAYFSMLTTNINPVSDWECSITTNWRAGAKSQAFGLNYGSGAVHGTAYDHRFSINHDGSYQILYFKNDSDETDLKDWTNSSYINQSVASNVLKVKKQGTRLYYYINDHLVTSIATKAIYGNQFGIVCEGAQTVAFDDFSLTGTYK